MSKGTFSDVLADIHLKINRMSFPGQDFETDINIYGCCMGI